MQTVPSAPLVLRSVADPHHPFDADPDPICHFDADLDPNPDPACHFDADPDHSFHFDTDPYPDPIPINKMRIRIRNTGSKATGFKKFGPSRLSQIRFS